MSPLLGRCYTARCSWGHALFALLLLANVAGWTAGPCLPALHEAEFVAFQLSGDEFQVREEPFVEGVTRRYTNSSGQFVLFFAPRGEDRTCLVQISKAVTAGLPSR